MALVIMLVRTGIEKQTCVVVLQVYSAVWKEKAVVVKCGLHDAQHDASLYDKPTRGTSMDEFREMLHSFLKVLLFIDFFLIQTCSCQNEGKVK